METMPGQMCAVIKAKGCSFFWGQAVYLLKIKTSTDWHTLHYVSCQQTHTSKTFFLLDLSFEAQPIVAPRSSTVTSGTI